MKEKLRKDNSPVSDGINNNTYDLLFRDFYNLPKEEQNSNENIIAFSIIDRFTRTKDNKLIAIFSKIQKLIYGSTVIDFSKVTYNEEKKEYEYKDNDIFITFDLLSNGFDNKNVINELNSKKRKGKCHTMSIRLAMCIKGSKIVTGYINLAHSKILHSFVEYENDNNETMILDWTLNVKMKKEDYVKLTKFEQLNSFSSEKIEKEQDLILDNLDLGVKPLVLFWEEIAKDLQRNKQIFENDKIQRENNKTKNR